MVLPGWTPPSTVPGTVGYTTATPGALSIYGRQITVTGLALNPGQTLAITYRPTAAPGTVGASGFDASEQPGGTNVLTAVASSPSVTVAGSPPFHIPLPCCSSCGPPGALPPRPPSGTCATALAQRPRPACRRRRSPARPVQSASGRAGRAQRTRWASSHTPTPLSPPSRRSGHDLSVSAPPRTAAALLFGPDEDKPSAMAERLRSADLGEEIRAVLDGLPPLTREAAVSQVSSAAAELLNVNLADVAADGWRKLRPHRRCPGAGRGVLEISGMPSMQPDGVPGASI
jgi:hypothetical protein